MRGEDQEHSFLKGILNPGVELRFHLFEGKVSYELFLFLLSGSLPSSLFGSMLHRKGVDAASAVLADYIRS